MASEDSNDRFLPYSIHDLDEQDREAVDQVLRSRWLTTGPKVQEFEDQFASFVGANHAVAVNSGTAALHAALRALNVGPQQEVIVSPLTFAASANAALYVGATPIFADVDPESLLIDPQRVADRVTDKTAAVVAVDYAGQPVDYLELKKAIDSRKVNRNIPLVADACHALGASDGDRRVGTLADLSCFSFHPVKHITTGEGGMVTTDNQQLAERMRVFRNHGILTDHRARERANTYVYDMVELGFNYRLSDLQCALGISQLRRSEGFSQERRRVAACYDQLFAADERIRPLTKRPNTQHGYHLYVVRLVGTAGTEIRDRVFREMRGRNIGVNVHYRPVYLHTFYQQKLGYRPGLCPIAEAAFGEILSLPIFPAMTEDDVIRVAQTLQQLLRQELVR